MEFFRDLFLLIGRLCIGTMFLWTALEKIKTWESTKNHLRSKGIPQLSIVLPTLIALKILGGLSVVFGYYAHIGALFLLIVTIPTLLKLHPFWLASGSEKEKQKVIFAREVAIIGGLFLLLAIGAGHWGIAT